MILRHGVAQSSAILLLTGALMAGSIPGRWEKLEVQSPGRGLSITLKSGEQLSGFFKILDATALSITNPAAGERRIPRGEIQRVETMGTVNDSVADGTAIGAAIGLGIGALGVSQADGTAGGKAGGLAFFAGLGALIGLLIDKGTKGPEVLYKAR